jgi:AcrR family transcriptional regulator
MTEPRAIRRRGKAVGERVLVAATALFDAQGINATTVEQIAAAAPVSKRTLYAHFPTKDDLVVAYLRHLQESGQTVDAVLERDELAPRDRLLALFDVTDEPSGLNRGCRFADAAAEFPDPASPVHAYAREHKRGFAVRLAEVAREAGVANPVVVGEQLAILSDGMASRAMVLNDASSYRHAKAMAETLLSAATP